MTDDDLQSANHGHDHDHGEGSELSEAQIRVRTLETILAEKGYVDPVALDRIVEAFETRIGPHNGARVVARAWDEPEFRARLLEDATEAVNSMGQSSPVGSHLIAVENTKQTHNNNGVHSQRWSYFVVVICLLCINCVFVSVVRLWRYFFLIMKIANEQGEAAVKSSRDLTVHY